MKNERFKNILKVNWFIYKSMEYNRDDWIQIICYKDESYQVVYSNWDILDINNKCELLWTLAINWIINRLF